MKSIMLLFLAGILAISTEITRAQEDHAYIEGPVTVVSFIRTDPGMFDEYVRYLDSTYKKLLDEYQKQGVITSYSVYRAFPRTPQDADVILTVTYKNMAAFDDLEARVDPIDKKVWGSLSKADQAFADRGKMRKDLGSQIVRQLILK